MDATYALQLNYSLEGLEDLPMKERPAVLDKRIKDAFATLDTVVAQHPEIQIVNRFENIGMAVAKSSLSYFETTYQVKLLRAEPAKYEDPTLLEPPNKRLSKEPTIPEFLKPAVKKIMLNSISAYAQ